jgi:hypothetical protein
MSRKSSIESRIINYFETAPLSNVEIVLGIVKEKVKSRQPKVVGYAKVTRKAKAKKTNPNVATSTTTFPAGNAIVQGAVS